MRIEDEVVSVLQGVGFEGEDKGCFLCGYLDLGVGGLVCMFLFQNYRSRRKVRIGVQNITCGESPEERRQAPHVGKLCYIIQPSLPCQEPQVKDFLVVTDT